MKLLRSVALCFALAVPALQSTSAQDAISLQQQWQVGKRYRQTLNMQQTSTIPAGDQNLEQTMEIVTEVSIGVAQHEDGKRKRLTVKYDRMAMDMAMGPQKMSFDSAKADGAAALPGFGELVGKEVHIVLDEKNVPVEVENLEEVFGAAGSNPALKGLMNPDSFKDVVRSASLAALPEKPVKPGDSWPFSVEMPLPPMGKASVKGQYTYKGMAERNGMQLAEIAAEAVFGIDASGEQGEGAAGSDALKSLNMKIEDSKMTSTVWFDPAIGMARESETSQTINMTMNNPTKAGEVIKLPIKQTITAKLTAIEDVK